MEAHVGYKVGELPPSPTDRYPPSSIITICIIFRVVTSADHPMPNVVNSGIPQSMLGKGFAGNFFLDTAATFTVAR